MTIVALHRDGYDIQEVPIPQLTEAYLRGICDLPDDPEAGWHWDAVGWAIVEAGGHWSEATGIWDFHEVPVDAELESMTDQDGRTAYIVLVRGVRAVVWQ